jgi:hypothetical protein
MEIIHTQFSTCIITKTHKFCLYLHSLKFGEVVRPFTNVCFNGGPSNAMKLISKRIEMQRQVNYICGTPSSLQVSSLGDKCYGFPYYWEEAIGT